MKLKYLFVGLMLLLCCGLYGQKKNSSQPQKSDIQALEETVSQLQAEDRALKKQMDDLQNEVDYYRGDVRAKVADFNDDLSQWLTVMAIMMAVVGIAIPIIINYRNEKSMGKKLSDVSNQAKEAKQRAEQAQKALAEVEDLKKHIDEIEKTIWKDKLAAEKAAKEAKASQFFAQALSESNAMKAIELYTKAIELRPDFSEAYNNRAILKKERGDNFGAMEDYDKAIKIDPNNAMIYCNRGSFKSELGDNENAIKDEIKALEIDHNCVSAYNNLSMALLGAGRLKEALINVNIAIDKDNNNHCFHDTKGQIYMAMGEYESALREFDFALAINDRFSDAFEKRAKCYRILAEKEEDTNKKAEWIAKAEDDEQKAGSLK